MIKKNGRKKPVSANGGSHETSADTRNPVRRYGGGHHRHCRPDEPVVHQAQ